MKRFAAFILALICLTLSASSQTILTADGLAAFGTSAATGGGGGGGCTSAYRTNDIFYGGTQAGFGTGRRDTSVITATMNGSSASWEVDNVFASGQFFFSGGPAVGYTNVWYFDGASPVITEIAFIQETGATHGIWQVDSSNDGSTWSTLGTTFTLGGAQTNYIGTLHGNTTGFKYLRMRGTSGNTSSAPWIYEVQFQNCQ